MMNSDLQQSLDRENQGILPLTSFQSDDLMEKLKILKYEKQLLCDMKMKQLSKFYFIKSMNPGEQFFMFTSICWWLLRKLGKDLEKPQEFDDPNETIGKIIKTLQEIDIQVDFPPNKLMQGAGPICLYVLDCLATQALKVAKIKLQQPHIKQDDEPNIDYTDDKAEIILEKLEDEQNAVLSDDSDMDLNGGGSSLHDLNWITKTASRSAVGGKHANENSDEQESWRLEVERALPQLKVLVKTDSRDWRTRINQMKSLKEAIESTYDETQLQLKKLHNELTFSLEKTESREKHLNNELHTLIQQFKDVSIELTSLQFANSQIKADSEQLVGQMANIVRENDVKKAEMEHRGQTMSDGSAVVQIKKAIARLKDDVSYLNLEVALLIHSIDQDILRQASPYAEGDSLLGSAAVKIK